MGLAVPHSREDTRRQILRAALHHFAGKGYAGTATQDIVDTAGVTKPVLYYHFESKAGLYLALIDWAAEERWRRTEAALEPDAPLPRQLAAILEATFSFVRENRELTRLAMGTLFAAPGEVPHHGHCLTKGRRVFDVMEQRLEAGRRAGTLKRDFTARELVMALYGMMNFQVMLHLVLPDEAPLDRGLAERLVRLFLSGAAPEGRSAARRKASPARRSLR